MGQEAVIAGPDSQEVAVAVRLWVNELHADLEQTLQKQGRKMNVTYDPNQPGLPPTPDLGNHGNAPQLLGEQALHDPLEGFLHLDDVVLAEREALLPEGNRPGQTDAMAAFQNKSLYLTSFFTWSQQECSRTHS